MLFFFYISFSLLCIGLGGIVLLMIVKILYIKTELAEMPPKHIQELYYT